MTVFVGTQNDDTLTGDSANDFADGNGGNDSLSGAGGSDDLAGGAGADLLDGGDGSDRLYSGVRSPSYNLPYANNGYILPVLDTGREIDTLRGGAGDDRIFAGYGDNVDGGANDYTGDYLFISFQGAESGVTADFRQFTLTIGGGTITGIENISYVQGGNFDDVIYDKGYGNGYSDFSCLSGMAGNDQLYAGYYTGSMLGGDGADLLDGTGSQYLYVANGGAGDDVIRIRPGALGAVAYGGDGSDTIYAGGDAHGGAGNDKIVASFSYYSPVMYGDAGDDELVGDIDVSQLFGGDGGDLLQGNAGDDVLGSADRGTDSANGYLGVDLGAEKDLLFGGDGDDRLAAGIGDDADGGAGNDTLQLSLGGATAGVTFDTATLAAGQPFSFAGGTIRDVETLEYLRGSSFADRINAATQATRLTIDGGIGDDVVTSNGSSVTFNGGAGNDTLVSGAAADVFDGGDGDDTVDYRNATAGIVVTMDVVPGRPGTGGGGDTLTNVEHVIGTGFDDTLSGSNAADRLDGGAGKDTLDGGMGPDVMRGGAGDDLYYVDQSGDLVFEEAGGGFDTVVAFGDFTLAAGQEVEVLSASATNASLTGNELNNDLRGGAFANRLNGGAGDDRLFGGGGDDLLDGGAGVDTAAYSSAMAQSWVSFTQGRAIVAGPEGRDTLTGVERLAFSDGALDLTAAAPVAAAYLQWSGRFAYASELAFWTAELAAGRTTLAGVRGAILDDPSGRYFVSQTVDGIYRSHAGRTAEASEVAVWQGLIRAGADFDTVRSAILGEPIGRTAADLIRLYGDYAGRAPSDGELGVWQNLLRNGATLDTARSAIIADPVGQAHLAATVTELYQDYGGRAPTAGEVDVWRGLIGKGATFADVRGAILDDQLGRSYTTASLEGLYQELFGRSAGAGEQAAWAGLFRGGADLDAARAALMTDGGSAGRVAQAVGTAGADSFAFAPGGRHLTVSGFDPAADTLDLRGLGLAGVNPLDASHAREIHTLGGGVDVLLTLDATHDVLLRGVTLGQLGGDDFLL